MLLIFATKLNTSNGVNDDRSKKEGPLARNLLKKFTQLLYKHVNLTYSPLQLCTLISTRITYIFSQTFSFHATKKKISCPWFQNSKAILMGKIPFLFLFFLLAQQLPVCPMIFNKPTQLPPVFNPTASVRHENVHGGKLRRLC